MTAYDPIIAEDANFIVETVGSPLRELEGKSVLVTGAKGMLGSYFLHSLYQLNRKIDKPCRVIGWHHSKIETTDSIGYLVDDDCFLFEQVDLANPFTCPEEIDCIIHAASHADPSKYMANPLETVDLNTTATRRFLEYSRSSGARMLFISSGQIYGDPPDSSVPTPESYTPTVDHLASRACHDESKRFGESLCRIYANAFGVDVKMARPIHVFGPGVKVDDSRVWADFIRSAVHGRNLEILGDGQATRGFCYIAESVVQSWFVLLKGDRGEPYNVGSDQEHSVRELAETVCQCSTKGISFNILNQIADNPSPLRSCPDISKVVQKFGVSPRFSMEQAVKRTLEWAERHWGELG